MGYKVAVVGATGNVGREMLDILAERMFPADEIVALASRRSQGVEISCGERTLKAKALEHFDFSDVDVPLVVPEVNADAVAGFRKKGIIANPNCSTAELVVVLKPLHDRARIKRVVVSTYQSVSGAGREAMDELF